MRLFSARIALPVLSAFLLLAGTASGQSIDVTFRYVERPGDNFQRIYNPGDFNNWGNNNSGVIPVGDPSQMTYDIDLDEYVYTVALGVGQTRQYKVHFHFDAAGSQWQWISDPYNDRTDQANNDNSVVTITDPMVFQPARKLDTAGDVIERVSAGIFGSQAISTLRFEINGASMDGMPFLDATKRIFQYDLPSPVAAGSQFKLVATDALGRSDSATVGIIPPIVIDEPLPPGVRDGITFDDADPTRVTLSLFAPGKDYVYVLGDFNGWEIREEYLMKRDSIRADSIRFWLTLEGLTPVQEYAFQYLVDGQIRVADPYSTKLLDGTYDRFLGSVYPGLKSYPAGLTSQLVGVFQTGENAFSWSPFERPQQKDLVIYELLVRDFIGAHDYATLTDTLDYLDRLGVNAIELMPVAEFDRNESWGYEPAFHLAADKYYGRANDLKLFIDECHKRGIAVILDVVYNHATGQSPLVRLYNQSPTGNPSALPSANSIYANTTARHPFNVFNDLNHESTATKYWLDRANEYWLTEFNVDGFRFDLSKGFTQKRSTDDSVMRLYDPSRIRILTRMASQIWKVDSTAYIILEHFAEDREERELAEYGRAEGRPGMMLWNNKHSNYSEAAMGYHGGGKSDFASVYYGVGGRGWTEPNLVSYMESHDEQWLMFKNLSYGACERSASNHVLCDPGLPENFGTYNIRNLNTALDRMKMAGAFFFTVPGPKTMWQFGELGYGFGDSGEQCLRGDDCPPNAPGRTARKPIRWDYRDDPLRERLYKTWAAIINLRRQHEVFTSTETVADLIVSGAVKRIRLSHSTMNVAIIGNFDVVAQTASIPFQNSGTWYDFFSGASIEVTDPSASFTLAPGEFHIYTDVRVDSPEPGLITVGVEEDVQQELPTRAVLEPPYPNPFNVSATIRFSLPVAQHVAIDVFDILGRHVATIADEFAGAGVHTRVWDATDYPSGPYVIRFESGKTIETVAVVRLK